MNKKTKSEKFDIKAKKCYLNPLSGSLSLCKDNEHSVKCDSMAEGALCSWLYKELLHNEFSLSKDRVLSITTRVKWKLDIAISSNNNENTNKIMNLLSLVKNKRVFSSTAFIEYKGRFDKNFLNKLNIIASSRPLLLDMIIICSNSEGEVVIENDVQAQTKIKVFSVDELKKIVRKYLLGD